MRRSSKGTKKLRLLAVVSIVLIAVTSSVVLFGAAEVAVRVRQKIKQGQWSITERESTDATSGLQVPTPGNFGRMQINSEGFRSPELVTPKPSSTVRLAFLGLDYCSQVSSNAHTWPHLVTQALQAHWPQVTLDYMNAGVNSHGINTTLRTLEYRVSKFHPDVIVIYEGNSDLTYNTFQLAVEQHIASKRADAELMWPARYSLLWLLLEKNLRVWALQRSSTQQEGKLKLDKEKVVAPFRHDLVELVQASQKVADLVVLVTSSTQLRKDQRPEQQARAAVTNLYYMPYMSINGLIEAFDDYNETIGEVAQQRGALLVADEDAIPGDAEHFVDSVHFTDKGSQAMADRIIPVLLSSNALDDMVSAKSGQLQ